MSESCKTTYPAALDGRWNQLAEDELLSVHSLAARPPENLETQLDFAELCRRSHRAALAASTLRACGDSQVAVSRAHCAPSLWSSSPKHSSWDARVRAASIPEESFSSEMLGASTTTLTDGDGDTVPALVPVPTLVPVPALVIPPVNFYLPAQMCRAGEPVIVPCYMPKK